MPQLPFFSKFILFAILSLTIIGWSSISFGQNDTQEIRLRIDRIECEEAQEDRVSDMVSRGDEIYLIYIISEVNDDGELLNTAFENSGIIEDVEDGDTIGRGNFPIISLEIAQGNGIRVDIALYESDSGNSRFSDYLEEFHGTISWIDNAGTALSWLGGIAYLFSYAEEGEMITTGIIDYLAQDEQLGEDSIEYDADDIEDLGSRGDSDHFTFNNEEFFIADDGYSVYFTVSVKELR